jgi:competence/damage-inducible protein cinA C-terminal domain
MRSNTMLEQSHASAHRLVHLLADAELTAATCESLTGGLVGATITSVPGASAIFRGGLITYASDLKTALAGVDADWIDEHGVINAMTARQMATGCAHACQTDLGLACTGVAGPDRQDGQRPGTVHIAVAHDAQVFTRQLSLSGEREAVRLGTVSALLEFTCHVIREKIEDIP